MESRPELAQPVLQKKYRKTLALVFLICAVFFAGGMFFAAWISGSYAHKLIPTAVGSVAGGIVFGAAMTWFTVKMWHRNGGPDTARLMQRAIRTRQLPPDIGISEWHRLLVKRESDALIGRWLYPIFFGIFTCLYLLVGVTNILSALGPLPWIGVALFAGFGIYSPFDTERRLRGIRALKTELAAQLPPEPGKLP